MNNTNSSILDCVSPYSIDIIFDATNDKGATEAANEFVSCGKGQLHRHRLVWACVHGYS